MSQYSEFTVKLRMAHYISYRFFDIERTTWITVVILELIHASRPDFLGGLLLLDTKPVRGGGNIFSKTHGDS
jgi:hypothetical protein